MKRESEVRDKEERYKKTLVPLVEKIRMQSNAINNLSAEKEVAWKTANEWEAWSNEIEKRYVAKIDDMHEDFELEKAEQVRVQDEKYSKLFSAMSNSVKHKVQNAVTKKIYTMMACR